MAKLSFREKAIADLSDIWEDTVSNWSESQADKYYRKIQRACEEISSDPAVGRRYKEISHNLLGFKTEKHIIFYHVPNKGEVEIIRILHEKMDLNNRIKE